MNIAHLTAALLTFASFAAAADDCDPIRRALALLPAEGGEVAVPAGTYVCAAPIVIDRSNVRLRGAGEKLVTIRLRDFVHAPLLIIGDPRTLRDANGNYVTGRRVENIEVSGLTLDGNRANHDPRKECGEGSCDGDSGSVRNNGITIRGASRILVENVTAHGMISGGLVTEKYCDRLIVRNFTSYDNYFDGFAGYETVNSTFAELHLHHNRGAGISIDINFNDNVFLNSRIVDNGDVGIFGRHIRGNRFVRTRIQRSGNHNIFLAKAEAPESCASDNVFEDVQVNFSQRSGLRLNDDCPGNRIIGRSNLCGNAERPISEAKPGSVTVDDGVLCR